MRVGTFKQLKRMQLSRKLIWQFDYPLPSRPSEEEAAFHQRATKLQSKGAAALFSMGEVKRLMNEGKAAGEAARQRRLAAIRAGQKPAYCPPEGPRTMESNEFLARLSQIPPVERSRIDITEAMTRILSRKFPCPA